MAYCRYNGVKYGVCSHRPIWKSLLVSVPIINLLYTKKIKVSLIRRTQSGVPITGIYGDFRIFRWQKTVKFRFMVHDTFSNVLVRVMNPAETVTYGRDQLSGTYFINSQYYQEVVLSKKEEI